MRTLALILIAMITFESACGGSAGAPDADATVDATDADLPPDPASSLARTLAALPDGDVVVGLSFGGIITIGSETLVSRGGDDIAIARLDPDGEVRWVRHFGGPLHDAVMRLRADAAGNVLASGSFQDTIDFGGGPLVSAAPYGHPNAFLTAFASDGTHRWSKRFGGPSTVQTPWGLGGTGTGVGADTAGNVVQIGLLAEGDAVDFGGGVLPALTENDSYLVKFSTDGEHAWSRRFGGIERTTDIVSLLAVAIDQDGGIVVTGDFYGHADLGSGPLAARGWVDMVLARYTTDGAVEWIRTFSPPDADGRTYGRGVAIGPGGEIVATGNFDDAVDFGDGLLETQGGGLDLFLASFAADGVSSWSKRIGGTLASERVTPWSIAVDRDGNIVVTGNFEGAIDFGGGAVSSVTSGGDLFTAKYSRDGTFLWVRTFGTGGNLRYGNLGSDVAVGTDARVFVAGRRLGDVDFGASLSRSFAGGGIVLRFDP